MLWHLLVLRLLHTQCAWATTLVSWSQRAQSDVESALQQQPQAVAPSGDGANSAVPRTTHTGEWECVAPLGVGTATRSNAHMSQVPLGQSKRPIQGVVQQRRNAGVQLCLSVTGYLRGGLANSMGVVNMAMDYSIKNDLNFVMPQIVPIDHDLGDEFAFMFGKDPVCATRTVSVWPASCTSSSALGTRPGINRPPRSELPTHDGCDVSEQVVHDSYKDTTSACDCDEVILVETASMAWSYDYSRTGPLLKNMYWKNAPGARSNSAALRFPLRTVMHVRLGDVEGDVEDFDNPKFLAGDSNAQLTMAFTSFIDAACLDVSILTDGTASDKNIRGPLNAWTEAGAYKTQVLDISTPASESLNTMARADILIGGPSGFPRFAAVLGNAQVKLFINEIGETHHIDYLKGVSEVDPKDIASASVNVAARKALQQNEHVTEVATACAKWLAAPGSSSD